MKVTVPCPTTWPYKRKPCEAWGTPGVHACVLDPGHEGIHRCPCGSTWKEPAAMKCWSCEGLGCPICALKEEL
jgi:hypothetical protein